MPSEHTSPLMLTGACVLPVSPHRSASPHLQRLHHRGRAPLRIRALAMRNRRPRQPIQLPPRTSPVTTRPLPPHPIDQTHRLQTRLTRSWETGKRGNEKKEMDLAPSNNLACMVNKLLKLLRILLLELSSAQSPHCSPYIGGTLH